jgi:16S rRNA G966 N2-methylase RsmD
MEVVNYNEKEQQIIAMREDAQRQLVAIKTIDEGAEYLSKVKALEAYARATKQDAEIVLMVQEQKLRSMRILGKLLEETEISKNASNQYLVGNEEVPSKPRLADLGITKNESSAYQKIASIPEEVFEQQIEAAKEQKSTTAEITTSGMLRVAKQESFERCKQDMIKKAQSIVISENNSNAIVERGNWYTAGPHKIYCGSNMDDEFINNLPDDFAFAFADPPYNEDLAEWDKGFKWEADYLTDIAKIVAVTPGIRAIPQLFENTQMPYKWSMSANITNGMTRGALGFGNWIYIALFSKQASIYQNAQDVLKVNISTSENAGHYHKGRKPSHLMIQLVELFTLPGGLIIDPFLGSGSTLFAAEKTGRICYGAEISPDYVSLILSNYGQNSI